MKKAPPVTELDALAVMKRCPRFQTCSVPSCPLDLKQDCRPVFPGEPRCRLSKEKRRALGKGTALPYGGLTAREALGEKRWASLSDEERAATLDRLAKTSFAVLPPQSGDDSSPEARSLPS